MTTSSHAAGGPRTPLGSPRIRRRLRGWAWRGRFWWAALLLGTAAAVTVHHLSPPRAVLTTMVVTERALPAGTTIAVHDVRTVHLPPDAVPPDALRAPADAVGRTVAVNLTPGSVLAPPVLTSDLASQAPPDSVVAAVRLAEPALAEILGPGMRVDLLAPATQHPGAAPAPDASDTDAGASAGTYLARGAVVLPVPRAGATEKADGMLALGGPPDDTTSDLVLVAVRPDEAVALASMTGWSAISAVLVH